VNPKVSFVVPCYKLCHLLAECVNSILNQTYENFEILIMDDCSPDDTPLVAGSFEDPRVRYIRNDSNLGHLRNYNKGIDLARGEYVWLISADDVLWRPYVLERYIERMEKYPDVGFACCAGLEIKGAETRLARYSLLADRDTVFTGNNLLKTLLFANSIIAGSGMVRRSCYERLGAFPLDIPYAGDWYLWCLFSLYHRVAYFAEPMVGYRIHGSSMTDAIISEDVGVCAKDDLAVLWRIKRKAQEAGYSAVAALCIQALASFYAKLMFSKHYRSQHLSMSQRECEESVLSFVSSKSEADRIWARIYACIAEIHVKESNVTSAREFYRRGLSHDFWMPKIWLKTSLLHMGKTGAFVRKSVSVLRGTNVSLISRQ
jgi:glycosyltransferase involved in cell wall biosynthesis